jgi:D-alanyl-D-alanine carboxypeptidase
VADEPAIRGAALAVSAPTLGLEWAGAAGLADPATGTAMTPSMPVRIASNTKTFVAAAVLRLVEDGRLDLDAPLAEALPREAADLLASDGYDLGAITVRHLLTHTSGIHDHTEGEAYAEAIVADPRHRWTPVEQIARAVALGDPHAPPGEVYSYCDTGYVLLGLVLERATGQPLAAAVRQLVDFEGLGLDSTWWETLEPAPAGVPDRAHQLFGDADTHGFDPSFDLYGGGGLVAPVDDVARFFGALFRGRVYHDPATLDLMLTTVEGARPREDASAGSLPPGAYRMGVWVRELEGRTVYQHTGFFGTVAAFVPDLDLTVAATVNQNTGRAFDRILAGSIRVVEDSAATPDGSAGQSPTASPMTAAKVSAMSRLPSADGWHQSRKSSSPRPRPRRSAASSNVLSRSTSTALGWSPATRRTASLMSTIMPAPPTVRLRATRKCRRACSKSPSAS